MVAYRAKQPKPHILDIPVKDTLRDCVLCPNHADVLDGHLIDLGRGLGEMPVMGSA